MKKTGLFLLLAVLALTACRHDNDGYVTKTQFLPVVLQGSEKWSLLNVETGEVVARDAFANAPSPVVDGIFYVTDSLGMVQFYDAANPTKPLSDATYGSATVFSENGVAFASQPGTPLKLIDRKGNVIKEMPADIVQCTMFVNGLAAFQNDQGKWGYLDTKGNVAIEPAWAAANLFLHDNVAVVMPATQPGDSVVNCSVIDKKGKVLFSFTSAEYRLIEPYFVSSVLPVVKNDSLVCLDYNGELTANPNDNYQAVEAAGYKNYHRTPAGYYLVMNSNNRMGLVDHNNNVLIEPQFANLMDISAERYIAMGDSAFYLVDRKGNRVGNANFISAHGSIDAPYATRGTINTDVVVATLVTFFDDEHCCGASRNTTLTDMRGLTGNNPASFVDNNTVIVPQGPYDINFVFDGPIARIDEMNVPVFNNDAKLELVCVSANLVPYPKTAEEEIAKKMAASIGTRGFVLDHDNIFVSDAGTAVNVGYTKGVVNMLYFFDKNKAITQNRVARK